MSVTDQTQLAAARGDAEALAHDASSPDESEEIWRYSRIGDVDLDGFSAIDHAVTTSATAMELEAPTVVVRVRDGLVVDIDGALPGVEVTPAHEHAEGEDLLTASWSDTPSKVELTHRRGLGTPIIVDVAARAHVEGVIVIDHDTDVAGGLTAPHTVVRAGRGASVTVLEHRRSGTSSQLVVPRVRLHAESDARIEYLVVQQLGEATTCLERVQTTVDQQAHVVTGFATFGGIYARTRSDFRLVGRGASGDLLAVYFGDGDQMLDFRTFQEHAAPDTTSNLLFKGAVTGRAQSVYTGLIRVAETAPGTDAYQTNRNLKLSDDAWAYSVPNLEIEQNQVSCSHASTVGEIDEEQRFYLESRGVPSTEAEQLLVSGFFAEVIDALPVPELRPQLRQIVDRALAEDRRTRAAAP